MDKKITIPAGIALMVVLAVAGMLAIFSYTAATPVQADIVADTTAPFDSPGKPRGDGDFVFKFTVGSAGAVPATIGELRVGVHKDYDVPDPMAESDAHIIVSYTSGSDTITSPRITPEGISIDDKEAIDHDGDGKTTEFDVINLTVADIDPDADGNQAIPNGAAVTVVIEEGSGMINPDEGGTYPIIASTSTEEAWVTLDDKFIPVVISLSDDEAGRGDSISVTGKGFDSGDANFWRDGNGNGEIDASAGESILCTGEVTDGVAECSFDLGDPFVSGQGETCGFATIVYHDHDTNAATPDVFDDATSTFNCNLLNARDGTSVTVSLDKESRLEDLILTLETSMSITPGDGAPGDTINVQLHDFPASDSVSEVTVGGTAVSCSGTCTVGGSGTASFTIELPNIESGTKTLKVVTKDTAQNEADAEADIIVTGAVLLATPATVIANQRISLTASGFSGSKSDDEVTITDISVGSQDILGTKVIKVDAGGTWSASLDLPVKSATTSAGNRVLTATDSKGRTGSVTLTIPERAISITPIDGRVGSTVTVTGTNFPARNSNGSSVQVSVQYGAGNTVSATPDSGGRWSATLTVPNSTTIPSNNTVTVTFEDVDKIPVIDTVNHSVPSAVITLTPASGPEGSRVSVVATGFKRYTPLTSVDVGGNPATPVPAPTTDRSGNVEFTFQVPGIETGVQGVTVDIGGTTANSGFTVVEAGGVVGAVTSEVETALEPLMDAGTLDRVFYFNNSTKEWQWYISDPDFASSNNLDDVVSGAPLWVLVTEDTSVFLNDREVDFTCADGSCWNLIVFP